MKRILWPLSLLPALLSGHLVAQSQAIGLSQGALTVGRDLFLTHCATCHGEDARGDGPAAASLRVAPGDLTQFARRNGGLFPSAKIYRVIEGRDVGAHGSVEMPVWGRVFRVTPSESTDAEVRARIEAIVRYLESIQERAGHEDSARRR